MKDIFKKKLIVIFILFICLSTFLIWNKNSDNITLDEVRLRDDIEISKKQFAMYIKNSDEEEYQEYTGDDLFPKGYKLNFEQSSCMDINGDEVDTTDVISQTNDDKIMVTSTKTVYCTFYFDKEPTAGDVLSKKVGKGGLKQTTGKGDLEYRYVGTTGVDNYICFGTTNKEQCIQKDNNYLYRIIGIDISGRLKIIKDTLLNTSVGWHTNYKDNAVWGNESEKKESSLHQGLNSSAFLDNPTYVPNEWKSKIDKTSWNIGDVNNDSYAQSGGNSIYNQELSASATAPSKIGLMYLSDYYYSLDGEGNTNCRSGGSSDYAKCKTSWLHLNNNGLFQSYTEWTMSRYGYDGNNYLAWYVGTNGRVNWAILDMWYAIRPVFYLNAEEKIVSGTGTSNNPYILESPGEKIAREKFGSVPLGLKTTLTGDMYRFVGQQNDIVNNYICFGANNCSNNPTNDHLYRIIGITSDGKIKIQKNSAIGTSQWYTSYQSDTKWQNSIIYSYLIENNFYVNSSLVTDSMKNKIETEHSWNIGDVKTNTNGNAVYNLEMNGKHTGAVGLAYLSDYYFAYNEGGTQNCNDNPYCKSWMIPSDDNRSKLWSNVSYEWTMSRYGVNGSFCYAWFVGNIGSVTANGLHGTYAIRPVFYLTKEATISKGTGTLEDPFILSGN